MPKLLDDGERRYVWRPTLAYAMSATSNDVVHVYHTDGLDSAWVLTNAAGAVTDVKRSDAFGVLVGHQGPSTQPFGFAGEQRDAETGLTYLRARMYDPSLGRFLQPDPIGGVVERSRTLHRFAYVWNSPLTLVDPTGLCPMCVAAPVAAPLAPELVAGAAALGLAAAAVIGLDAYIDESSRPSWGPGVREGVFDEHGRECAACGAPATTVDHHHPWKDISQGLTTPEERSEAYNDPSNLVPMCGSCNPSKNAQEPEQWYEQQWELQQLEWDGGGQLDVEVENDPVE